VAVSAHDATLHADAVHHVQGLNSLEVQQVHAVRVVLPVQAGVVPSRGSWLMTGSCAPRSGGGGPIPGEQTTAD
jgi:hypothetical protein